MKASDIIERVELSMTAEWAEDAYCQCILATKNARCPNKAKVRCPDCKRRYCRKCSFVTSCCHVSVGNRVDVEVLP